MDYETEDRWALLSILHICPRHNTDLQPVALCEDVWGCKACNETWHFPLPRRWGEVYDGGQ